MTRMISTDRRLAWPLLALLACALIPSGACTLPPTQLLVVVDSDYGPGEIVQIEVRTYEVNARDEIVGEQTIRIVEGSEAGVTIPFSFGVVPVERDARRRVVIELTARERRAGGQAVLVRAITGFVRHETRRLPMFIAQVCAGRFCEPDETCARSGMCVPAGVEPGPPVVPGEEFQDAGPWSIDAGIDATSPDAYRDDVHVPPGVDADLDAAPDPDAFELPDAFVAPGTDAPFPDAFVDLDAFVVPDAFELRDAGFDAAFFPDVLASVDAGFDAAFFPDVLAPVDAGFDAAFFPDASMSTDAPFFPDASMSTDAPLFPDASMSTDAPFFPDASMSTDAPFFPDASMSTDAPFFPDASMSTDAPLFPDAPFDGGTDGTEDTGLVEITCDAACPDDGGARCMVTCP
jgi:hypothetical protein